MKASKISFRKNFQVSQFLFENAEIEVPINEGETEEQALDYGKKIITDWWKKNNPEIQTDYFTGPADVQQGKTDVPEQKALGEIKIALNNLQTQEDAVAFVKDNYPDYLDHFTVKTLIKIKPIKKGKK